MNRLKILLVCLGISLALGVFSETKASYKSSIEKVSESGYYHLQISIDALAVARKNDLSDIRIKDAKGEEQSYFIRAESPKQEAVLFDLYTLQSNEFVIKDSTSRIVVDNAKKEELSQFCIRMNNADVYKAIALKGSDDGLSWYVVKQKAPAPMSLPYDDITEMIVYNFPKGAYRYYEISLSNSQRLPLNILDVGKYKYSEILGEYTDVPLGNFAQIDSSNKVSYIHFNWSKKAYWIDKLVFSIEQKQVFRRDVYIHSWDLGFVLSSTKENIIQTPRARLDSVFCIEIENRDNKALHINDIKAFSLKRYICVYLEKDVDYSFYCGDASLPSPQYDLSYFTTEIPNSLPIISLGALEEIPFVEVEEEVRATAWFERPIFLWSVILGVGALIALMCYTMIQEMKKRG
ncbi:hypothetical protein AwDysgo_02740 [Bacteroidales bacterium]|nr:hypothetical protein AwDysgo_02740 [Bacteroidales bacterium]